MPMIGATLDSASVNGAKTSVTWGGTNLGENQYPICAARVTKDGGANWIDLTITTWGGLTGTGTVVSALDAGTYTLEVTTSDGEVLTKAGAFEITSDDVVVVGQQAFEIGIFGFAIC